MVKQIRGVMLTLVAGVVLISAGCTASGGLVVPDRAVPISIETAVEAQTIGMAALATGNVEWTESQFSSFLTELLKANTGKNMPVEAITVWFEPEQIYFRLQLLEDVLPAAFGTTLDAVGTVAITDGHLTIDLQEAAAGPYTVSGAMLAPINAQINNALAGAVMSIPVTVTLESGKLMIGIAQ